jgi:predicted ribosomally synthesized peptide with nif11-like leader
MKEVLSLAKKLKREELTKDMVKKALRCKNADELLALAQAEGYEMTRDEAEAYMAELADFELDDENLKNVAGGGCYMLCPQEAISLPFNEEK